MLPILVHKGKIDFSIATRFDAQYISRGSYKEQDTPHSGHLRGSASEVDSAASCGGKFPFGSAKKGCTSPGQDIPEGDLRRHGGGRMMTQKRKCLCVCCLPVVFLVAASAWGQITPRDAAFALRSSRSTNPGKSGEGAVPSEPKASVTVTVVAGHDTAPVPEATPGGNDHHEASKADPTSTEKGLPPSMTVRTAALLELHAMRQSAVDLCLQLPAKYRTQLPQCAEIFKHEIRLKALAQEKQ